MQRIKIFSKEAWAVWLVKVNQYLSKPISMLGVLILIILAMFIYFAIDNQKLLKDTKTSADNSSVAISQLKKLLCEDIPDEECNLIQAVADLKKDHDKSTEEIISRVDCLLIAFNLDQYDDVTNKNCKQVASGTVSSNTDGSPAASQPSRDSSSAKQPKSKQAVKKDSPRQPKKPTPLLGTTACLVPELVIGEMCL